MSVGKEGVVRQKQVPSYMGDIRAELEQIENSVSLLRDSLAPVLKDDLLSSEESNKTDEETLVPFACDLRDFHRRMKTILSAVNYMNEALEL